MMAPLAPQRCRHMPAGYVELYRRIARVAIRRGHASVAQCAGMCLEAPASQPDASVGRFDALRKGGVPTASEKRPSAPAPSISRDSSLGELLLARRSLQGDASL
jgi:hypothetical protein